MSTSNMSVSDTAQPPESLNRTEGGHAHPSQILPASELSVLNVRSNRKGVMQLIAHLAVMGISGYLWMVNLDRGFLALPALAIYGFSLASMFAPLHECVHRTVFAHNRLNDIVAWFAGLLSFYNSTFYRRYHKWHHRYAQIPDRDSELSDPKPSNLREYVLEISGLPWWIGKVRGHFRIAISRLENCPYISDNARKETIHSTR